MSGTSNTPISRRERLIQDAYAELFRAAESVRDSRLLVGNGVDDAHLEHSLDELERALVDLEALL